ncbi:MAG: hypothetical protein ABIH63_01130 [archaeon]
MEPKLIVRKDGKYFELKVGRKDIEKLLDGKQMIGRDEAIAITEKIRTEKIEITSDKQMKYGSQIALIRKFTSDTKIAVNGKVLIEVIDDFFGRAKTYGIVYRAPYVMIENLKIYDRVFGEDNMYHIGGLAQLLK